MTLRRSLLGRQTPKLMAEDARQLLQNPVVQKVFDTLEQNIIEAISKPHNGGTAAVAYEQELCREIRTIKNLRRGLSMLPQRQDFKEKLPKLDTSVRKTD